jgi:hypothetical protein
MQLKFIRNVTKGSRFNQIYIPKSMEGSIEAGDVVEVKLLKKRVRLHYSEKLKKLSEFKETLIKDIFSYLEEHFDFTSIFIVGSFLIEKVDYNDIDIVLISKGKNNDFENIVYRKLIEKFNLKFHIISIEEQNFWNLLQICPLTKSMFSYYISNNPFIISNDKHLNKKHLKFLLMMPYDLLEINLSSRRYFDNIRRLVTIERFLKNESLGIADINDDTKNLVGERIYYQLKNDDEIEEIMILALRKIIRLKLKLIEKLIEKS